MESSALDIDFGPVVHIRPASGAPEVLVLCEHASNRVPAGMGDLGLSAEALQSHIAWDPGAMPMARVIAEKLNAVFVWGGVSRLVYDCNRPPDAASAMPPVSEVYRIPGNQSLSDTARAARVRSVYDPFCAAVQDQIDRHAHSLRLLVTIHSFSPTFHGRTREVQIGVLHGQDTRFATAMVQAAPAGLPFEMRLNEPYSAADGVAHSLDLHGARNGLANVMLEVRNDLITTGPQQDAMAGHIARWIEATRSQQEPGV